jgi:predicted metal-dependent peptidase
MDVNKSIEKQKELGVEVKTADKADGEKLVKEALTEVSKLSGSKSRGGGKGMIRRAIEKLAKPKVDWKAELRRIVGKIAGGTEEYFGKKKHLYRDEYFYGDRDADADRLKDATVAVDTSGSISDSMLKMFLGEIVGIIKAKQIKKTEIVYFDYGIQSRDVVKNPPTFDWSKAKGGGGTSFIDPIQDIYTKWKKGKLELAVFITDGYGDQDGQEFAALVPKLKKLTRIFIWVIVDNPGFDAPFGKVIHIDSRKEK